MNSTLLIAVLVFVTTYVLIISEKVHRTVLALAGAILMILLGVVNQEEALHGVDFNTLGLLIGMMVIVGIAKDCGMFQFVAIWASKVGRGKPLPIFILLGLITAVFSAFLDNVTTVLLMVPVTFVVANNLKINPMPYLISTILLSNIGGTATLIGDPPNILIGSAAKIPFNDFLIHLGPVVVIVAVVTIGLLVLWYRKSLVATKEAQASIMQFVPKEALTDRPLLIKSLFVLALVLLGFFTHSITHLEGATIALGGAALLLLLTMNDPEHHLRDVEWTTIFFFIGLFVLVSGLESVGAIEYLAGLLIEVTGGEPVPLTLSVLWGSAVFSAAIDNIPFVATMIPLIQNIGEISTVDTGPLWWALALGADIGGNATIVGASANVVVSGMAGKHGHRIGFVPYMKVAMPMTFVALVICTIYISLRYLS
ncbi:MAG: ArsB/NhaD family transporter [Candidatus Gracilibacteria bacterium]|jgi:Na+/H+ antiporter NhaD/arsenite permease-like protein